MTYGENFAAHENPYIFTARNFAFLAEPRSHTMSNLKKRTLSNKKRGQGMTEYIIIVALIAIAAIGVITLFGDNIRHLFSASADALAGETSVTPDSVANSGKGKNISKKGLKDFSERNAY
jgi:pilus assembly protein Flp/PilA